MPTRRLACRRTHDEAARVLRRHHAFSPGRGSHREAVQALYGVPEQARVTDARRLALYGRMCQRHRFEVLEGLYPHCVRAVRDRQGEEGWAALVEAYYRAHPMRAAELNANGAHLPEFLTHYAPAKGLPEWLPELADVEWWEWEVLVAPDHAQEGPRPCLASTVDLRPYHHDLVEWMDAEPSARADAPEPRASLVLFWRDPEGNFRRGNASALELHVIKAVHAGQGLDATAAEAGLPVEDLEATRAELIASGVILGFAAP
ncbi:putative DNA-binding domain-containing protein [Cystobacter fuscus]